MATPDCLICAVPIYVVPIVRTNTKDVTEFTANYNHSRRLFPSELDLINLTYFEYSLENLKTSDTCVHIFQERMKPAKDGELLRCCEYMSDKGWILLETFAHLNENLLSYIYYQGQFGAAFFNSKSKQLVIVHRGTSFKNWSSVGADWNEVAKRIVGDFGCRAYLYTKHVIESYGLGAESVTVTGHSLGGWLAQVSAFYMQHPKFLDKLVVTPTELPSDAIRQMVTLKDAHELELSLDNVAHSSYKHLHCVSFDGPGCKEAIEIMLPGGQKYGEDRKVEQLRILDSLDVNVYFCELDIVNIVNEQIGSVFYMEMIGQNQAEENQAESSRAGGSRIFSGLLSLGKSVLLAAPGVSGARDWYKLFVAPHSCVNILNFWIQYDKQVRSPQEQILARVIKVTDWPVKRGFKENVAASHHNAYVRNLAEIDLDKKRGFKRFRMSCFNRDERKHIETALACKEFYQKDKAVWNQGTDFCIKFLASDVETEFGFKLEIFYQIIQLNEQCVDSELFRDFFIRKMKFHVREFKMLNITKLFPNYLEAVYVSRTAEYVKTLPVFSNTEAGFLELIVDELRLETETRVISVRAEKEDSRICTAKIFQVVQQQADLKLPKQYLVVSTLHLARMEDILANESAPFLPDLKYVMIECLSEYEVEIVNKWIEKLCAGRPFIRKIVVVFPSTSVKKVNSTNYEHKLSQENRKFLRESLDIPSLMESRIEFKLQGHLHSLSEFFGRTESGQPADSATSAKDKMIALVPEGSRASIPQVIYSVLEKGSLGTLLPQLDDFEEAYFLRRTYQEIAIKNYSKEDVFIVCFDSKDLEVRARYYLDKFIKQHHKDPNLVLCQNVFDNLFGGPKAKADDWEEFYQKCQKYNFIRVVSDGLNNNQEKIWRMQKRLNELNLKGHIVQLKDYVPPEPKKGNDRLENDNDRFRLVWLCSFGELTLNTNDVQEIGAYDYEMLAESTCRLTMIADEPGMGKTIVMQKLAIISQRAYKVTGTQSSPHYTIFMELGNVSQILRKELSKEVSVTNIVNALSEIESVDQKQIIGAVLTHLLKQEGKVRIFFDGLDEIDDELRAIVLEMVDVLLLETKSRIHIAFRDRLAQGLQERFNSPCLKLTKFSDPECVKFLSNYWQKHAEFKPLQFMKPNLVKVYIQEFLKCFEAKFGPETKKFIGIPFQLRLLAAAYMRDPFYKFYDMYAGSEKIPDKNVLLDQKLLPEFTDLAGLYKLFIDTKIRDAFKEKYGLDLETQKEFLKEKAFGQELLKIHRMAGFDKIFCALQRMQISSKETRPTRGQTEALHFCGIVSHYKPNDVTKSSSDDTEFVHQTLAEYFAAEFIFEQISPKIADNVKDKVQKFLDSYLFLSRYENVLNFLNMLILESSPPILKLATSPHANAVEIMEHFNRSGSEVENRGVDCLGRNFMHYVIMYSKSWLDKRCPVCRRNKKSYFLLLDGNLLKQKDMFDATPFAYIFANRDFVYLGMHGTTIAFASLLLNMNVHWQLESSSESSLGYSGHDANDSWDRKQKVREKANEFLRKYRQPGYQLDIPDWHELNSLSRSCSCNNLPQFPEPDVQHIVRIINETAVHLSDVQIELRRNSASLAYCLHDVHHPGKELMSFALGLKGESRVVFLCELARKIRPDDEKSFQTDFVELLKENEYEHYKRSAGYLDVDEASGLLEMFRGEVKPEQIKESLKRDIFSAWVATDFTSLRQQLLTSNCLEGHFERFCMFMPKSKGSSGNKRGGGVKLLQIVEEWLKTTKPGYHDREEKLACMLPMLWLVLDTHDFTEFVHKHESDIVAIDDESINKIADITFYKTLTTKLCECLHDAGETGETLLAKIKEETVNACMHGELCTRGRVTLDASAVE